MNEAWIDVDSAGLEGGTTCRARVRVRDTGAGPATLLCLHGFSDNLHTWQELRSALASAGVRLLALDLPGFGRSPLAPHFTRDYIAQTASLVRAVARRLRAEGADPILLTGNSLGAAVGLAALLGEGSEAGATCADGGLLLAPGTLDTRTPPFVHLLRAPVYRWSEALKSRLSPAAARRAARWLTDGTLHLLLGPGARPSDAWRQSMVESFLRPGSLPDLEVVARDILWTLRGRSERARAIHSRLNDLSTPIHILRGDRDRVIGEAELRALTASLPNARLETLPGVGHCPQNEAAARCAEVALDMLRAAGWTETG